MSERENPLRAEKRRKLQNLREAGIDSYPHNFERNARAAELLTQYENHLLDPGETTEAKALYRVAGRVMTKRPMGKAAFFNLQDQTGNLQVYLKTEEVLKEDQIVWDNVDLGDIIGVDGYMFRTKKGELTLHAKKLHMLCKTLEPLPEKYHGLTDIELKYRYRHLDLVMDPDSRKVFETRARIIREIRKFLDDRGFLEVETPILQPTYGGAAAHPFETHHRTLDMKLYLKISPELYLKRLIVGGFDKVYDLNKNFRNEGIDRSHNPEFTMIEWYEAYTDYNYQMKQFEDLMSHLAQTVRGSTKFVYQEREIDFAVPWERLTMFDAIRKYGDIDVTKMTDGQIYEALKKNGSSSEGPCVRGEMIAELFELTVESKLWNPVFILDHPIEISPLTKSHRTHKGLVERFEPFAAGMEIGNAYTELNDPEEQLRRLKEQEAKRATDEEAHPMDEDFMHAIDVGLPPTGGVGLGVERVVMILTDRPSIRDIILFPTMKYK